MIWMIAHAGHWLVQVAYVAPLVLLAGILVANQLRERRERREADGAGDDSSSSHDADGAAGTGEATTSDGGAAGGPRSAV